MKTLVNRREAAKWMLSASISSAAARLSASKVASEDASSGIDFGLVRNKVHDAILNATATGVAVSLIQGGRIVWEEGFGWANREAGQKATPHTPFSMTSITRPFTATTLMTLVAEGKLSLDEAANNVLVEGKIFGANGNPGAVTDGLAKA